MEMSFKEIKYKLKEVLSEYRYEHVLRVVDTALKLNNDLDLMQDETKVRYAALLHDCAKSNEEKYYIMFKDKYNLSESIFDDYFNTHAILGEIVAKEIYGISDPDVLNAIRWHTTGNSKMSMLEKLIYVADYVEPGREFVEAQRVREKLYENFNEGVLLALDTEIKYLIDQHVVLNLDTIKARNYLQRRVNE